MPLNDALNPINSKFELMSKDIFDGEVNNNKYSIFNKATHKLKNIIKFLFKIGHFRLD